MQPDQNGQPFQQIQQLQSSNSYFYPNQYTPNGQQMAPTWTPTSQQKTLYNGQPSGTQPLSPLVQQNGHKLPQLATNQMLLNPYHAPPAEPKRIDENTWAETATAMTGATSDTAFSDNISRFGARFGLGTGNNSGSIVSGAAVALIRNETDDIRHFSCTNSILILVYFILFLLSILSPIQMVVIAKGYFSNPVYFECNIECYNTLIGIFLKTIFICLLAYLYVNPHRPFFRKKDTILPKRTKSRLFFAILLVTALALNWFFYVKNVIQAEEANIIIPVKHASITIDCILFVYMSAVIYETWLHRQQKFIIHVVRSPDGYCKSYSINNMNVQSAAVEVLSRYFIDFPVCISQNSYNSKRLKRLASGNGKDQAPLSASSRIYEEVENEKKIRKRKMRLLIAVEEAFNSLKKKSAPNSTMKLKEDQMSLLGSRDKTSESEKASSTDPYELAQSIFPALIRPLQKYIRITKQQARHPVDTVLHHLAICIAYNVSPTVFMQRFLTPSCTVHEDAATASEAVSTAKKSLKELKSSRPKEIPNIPHLPSDMAPGGQQKWMILVDRSLTNSLSQGLVFQLKRGSEVSLLCTVNSVPLIQIVEDLVTSGRSRRAQEYHNLNGMSQSSDPNTV